MTKTMDRMAAYEAPRVPHPGRPMTEVTLKWRGHRTDIRSDKTTVRLPKMSPMPMVMTCRGRIFLRRADDLYVEVAVWPIIEELDAC